MKAINKENQYFNFGSNGLKMYQSDSGFSVSFGGPSFFGAFHVHWPSLTTTRFTIEKQKCYMMPLFLLLTLKFIHLGFISPFPLIKGAASRLNGLRNLA